MENRSFTYLFWVRYLGARYHGWQKQPNSKTVQGRIEKSIKFVLGHDNFSTLGASRTDAGVSCNNGVFELFICESLIPEDFKLKLNACLPDDIAVIRGQKVTSNFNVIQDVISKKYCYYFSCDKDFHPFASAHLSNIQADLDIELMQRGVKLFEGKYDFRRFCTKKKMSDNYVREIFEAGMERSTTYKGAFIPNNVFCFRIKGNGFLMHQVRFMMGTLFELGQRKISLQEIVDALKSNELTCLSPKAPANGLVLDEIWFNPETLEC